MAGMGDKISNVMWQMMYQQMLDQMQRESNNEYLTNQYGGSMISNVLSNALYDRTQNNIMDKSALNDARSRVLGLGEIADWQKVGPLMDTIRALGIDLPDIPNLAGLADASRQSLNAQGEYIKGTPVENIGLTGKYTSPSQYGKAQEGFIKNFISPKDLVEWRLQGERIKTDADATSGADRLAGQRDVVTLKDKAVAAINNAVQSMVTASGKADPMAVKALIMKVYKDDKDMQESLKGQEGQWWEGIGQNWFKAFAEVVERAGLGLYPTAEVGKDGKPTGASVGGGTLDSDTMAIFAAAQNPVDVFKRWTKVYNIELEKVQKLHESLQPEIDALTAFDRGTGMMRTPQQTNRLQELLMLDKYWSALTHLDPTTGAVVEGDPDFDRQFQMMIWRKTFYGE